jgi:hypothetical protein
MNSNPIHKNIPLNDEKLETVIKRSKSKPRIKQKSKQKSISKKIINKSRSKIPRSKTPKKNSIKKISKSGSKKSINKNAPIKNSNIDMKASGSKECSKQNNEISEKKNEIVLEKTSENKSVTENQNNQQTEKVKAPESGKELKTDSLAIEMMNIKATQNIPLINQIDSIKNSQIPTKNINEEMKEKTKPLKPTKISETNESVSNSKKIQAESVVNANELKSNHATKCESSIMVSPNKSKLNENTTNSIFMSNSQPFNKHNSANVTSTESKQNVGSNKLKIMENKSKSDCKKNNNNSEFLVIKPTENILKTSKSSTQVKTSIAKMNNTDPKSLIRIASQKVNPVQEEIKQTKRENITSDSVAKE